MHGERLGRPLGPGGSVLGRRVGEPLGVIGIAVGVVLLPELARRLRAGDVLRTVDGRPRRDAADLRAAVVEGEPDRTVLIAEEQTAGSGRRGRSWASPPGQGLYLSVLLRPTEVPMAALGSLAVVADIHTTAGKLADLKRRVEDATHAGSARAVEKQHAKGKMTARERVALLLAITAAEQGIDRPTAILVDDDEELLEALRAVLSSDRE